MIAYCGLDCSKCAAYIATQKNDDKMRAEVATEWSKRYGVDIKPEYINCDGCKQDGRKVYYCEHMCEIRKCCSEKGLDHCAQCDLYICAKLEKILSIAPEAKQALDNLRE